MRRTTRRIVPAPVPTVHKFFRGHVPARQFDHRIEPGAEMPAADIGPHVADLLLACAAHLLDVVEVLLNGPAIGHRLQNLLDAHLDVRTEIGRPVATFVFQQHDADRSTGDLRRGQEASEVRSRK